MENNKFVLGGLIKHSLRFSVIIPIYKVRAYLDTCIESVLNQDFQNFEIILVVDEESLDGCLEISERYAKSDSRIKIITVEHIGLGHARNCGLDIATGEYIVFIDSDDFLGKNNHFRALDSCIQEREPDYIIARHRKLIDTNGCVVDGSKPWKKKIIEDQNFEKKMVSILDSGQFNLSAWAKAIRRELIEENNIRFANGISEDIDWTGRILNSTDRIEVINDDSYVYRIRDNSLSKRTDLMSCLEMLDRMKNWASIIQGNTEFENAQKGIIAGFYYIVLGYWSALDKKDQSVLKTKLDSLSWCENYARTRKVKCTKLLCTIFGQKYGGRVINMYIHR